MNKWYITKWYITSGFICWSNWLVITWKLHGHSKLTQGPPMLFSFLIFLLLYRMFECMSTANTCPFHMEMIVVIVCTSRNSKYFYDFLEVYWTMSYWKVGCSKLEGWEVPSWRVAPLHFQLEHMCWIMDYSWALKVEASNGSIHNWHFRSETSTLYPLLGGSWTVVYKTAFGWMLFLFVLELEKVRTSSSLLIRNQT